jgi:hypothetical protein
MYLYGVNIWTALCFDRYICVERKTFSFTCQHWGGASSREKCYGGAGIVTRNEAACGRSGS